VAAVTSFAVTDRIPPPSLLRAALAGGYLFLSLSADGAAAGSGPDPVLTAKYCAACHLPPPPDAIVRDRWAELFELMRGMIEERQMPFDEAEYASLLAAYESAAPEVFDPIPDDLPPSPIEFERGEVGLECSSDRPRITNVLVTDLDRDGRDDVIVCDDVAGRVSWLRIESGTWNEVVLAEIPAPSRVSVVDYDGDGHLDVVVASIGFVEPTDDLIGSVWLLVNRGDTTFEPRRLVAGLPRVADVKPIDYNGNGKIDFVVACFGWRKSGGIVLLEQVHPKLFVEHRVADRNGAMQIEVADWNGDGHDDFVVLFAQEHESVELYLNDGHGRFEWQTLARAPHPAWGSSGIQLVDLDQDGDLDLVWTNGDMMDEVSIAKPYHGVRWLENRGGELIPHELVRMPGCYRAVVRDIDGDGHLDLVASSLNFFWPTDDFPSLLWLRNDGRQNFSPFRILHSPTNLVTMDVGDLDHDGIPDIIVGGMHLAGPLGRHGRLTAAFGKARTEPSPEKPGPARP
jgi:hypothetical protein